MSGGIGPAASLGGNLSANALVKLLETPFGVQGYFKSVLLGFFVFFVFCFFFFFLIQCSVLKRSHEALGVSFPRGLSWSPHS